jgi:hypothetical protein
MSNPGLPTIPLVFLGFLLSLFQGGVLSNPVGWLARWVTAVAVLTGLRFGYLKVKEKLSGSKTTQPDS